MGEDAWTSRDPERMTKACTEDSWRNRIDFIRERSEITESLQGKSTKEIEYQRINELWECYTAFRFSFEYCMKEG